MIVDPFDRTQGITSSGKVAAQVYLLTPGSNPNGDLGDAAFVGLAEVAHSLCQRHGEWDCEWCRLDAKDER